MTLIKSINKLLVSSAISLALLINPVQVLAQPIQAQTTQNISQKRLSEKECIETFLDICKDYEFAFFYRWAEYGMTKNATKLTHEGKSKKEIEQITLDQMLTELENAKKHFAESEFKKEINLEKKDVVLENLNFTYDRENTIVTFKNIDYDNENISSKDLNKIIKDKIQKKVDIINYSLGKDRCFFEGRATHYKTPFLNIFGGRKGWFLEDEFIEIVNSKIKDENSILRKLHYTLIKNQDDPALNDTYSYLLLNEMDNGFRPGFYWEGPKLGSRGIFVMKGDRLDLRQGEHQKTYENDFLTLLKKYNVSRTK